ncbi:MAG: S-methyl-5'-thioadenosine phosphorylase [Deltaproteobacteria bacterium]|nr:MAG: S-methyl-5'-thioadenosine phosphorylase [Deltaproteobacteria bacterium]
MAEKVLGIIGGSGLYDIEGVEVEEEVEVETPFGPPSDRFIVARYQDVKIVFLPRHGRGHRIPPSKINYRANIYGMKKLGARRVLSVSAVGSMKEEIRPGDIVVVDQFYDNTKFRVNTFFDEGLVGHIAFADPVCPQFSQVVSEAAGKVVERVHRGGTYICIEGPQFSTRAESNIYRSWGVDVIGMTNVPEVKLAREAGLCYSTMALATDYDCWREGEEDVTADMVVQTLKKNVANSKKIILEVARSLPDEFTCGCADSLKNAIMTSRELIPEELKKKLDLIVGEHL